MREAEFREWLVKNGAKSDNAIATRISNVRRVEKVLGDFDYQETDLDQLHNNDKIAGLSGKITALIEDFLNGGTAYKLLTPDGNKPLNRLRNYRAHILRYGQFLDEVNGKAHDISSTALNQLKQRFLARFPDFESGGGFAGQSSYHPEEDHYKRALIDAAQTTLAEHGDDPAALGGRLLDLVSNESEVESNLLGWRMAAHLKSCRAADPGTLEHAAGRMVLSPHPRAGVMGFVEETWPLLAEGQDSKPYSNARTIPTLTAALAHPGQLIGLRTDRFQNLFDALYGDRLFANAPLTRKELDRATDLADELFAIMRDEWNWHPRDLWDVQGFVWVACAEKLTGGNGDMTDAELLARFDGHDHFHESRQAWTDEQASAFCRMARAVHDAGLDWYHTNIPQVRFGRRAKDAGRAQATVGQVDPVAARLHFSHSSDQLGLSGSFDLTAQDADRFAEIVSDANAAIAAWDTEDHSRDGLWPDDYGKDRKNLDDPTPRRAPEPTNLILYGPPGTGKTYRTAYEAVRLCDGQADYPATDDGRKALMMRYDELRVGKRIAFVTFHQSYSYEDFVEGLRPPVSGVTGDSIDDDAPEETGLRLRVHDGIFKEAADLAKLDIGGDGERLDRSRTMFKIALGRKSSPEERHQIEEGLAQGFIHLGWGGRIDWSDERFEEFEPIRQKWNKDVDPDATGKDPNIEMIFTFRASMQIGDYVVLSNGSDEFLAIGRITGDYHFDDTADYHPHRRTVEWLYKSQHGTPRDAFYSSRFRRHATYRLNQDAIDWDALDELVFDGLPDSSGQSGRPHVLIIDEINRANVSKVFGELITLIEPDKRLGGTNALTVRLPYSKRDFGVPANLHIVGTMNTADRSIMQLDTALRRRFRFEELMPDTSVPAFVEAEEATGLPLADILDTINQRIEYLLDRDHTIGHSFFIGCKSRTHVDEAMRFKIIPLLQEYFFEDWSRIEAVIGKGFVSGQSLPAPPGISDKGDRKTWTVRWKENGAAGFAEDAYDTLLGGSKSDGDNAPQTPDQTHTADA